jgi:hypothetical protein
MTFAEYMSRSRYWRWVIQDELSERIAETNEAAEEDPLAGLKPRDYRR